MNLLLKISLGIILSCSLLSLGNADTIKIKNNTGKNIYFRVTNENKHGYPYVLRTNKSTTYRPKGSDRDGVKIYSDNCVARLANKCVSSNNLRHQCSSAVYNAEQINTININALGVCEIICKDGDSTSCQKIK